MADTEWQGTICPKCDQLILTGYHHNCPADENIDIGGLIRENDEMRGQLALSRGQLMAAGSAHETIKLRNERDAALARATNAETELAQLKATIQAWDECEQKYQDGTFGVTALQLLTAIEELRTIAPYKLQSNDFWVARREGNDGS